MLPSLAGSTPTELISRSRKCRSTRFCRTHARTYAFAVAVLETPDGQFSRLSVIVWVRFRFYVSSFPSFYLRTYSACARATYINGEGTRWRRGVGHLSEGIRDPSLFTCPGRGFDSRSLGIAIASSFDAHVRPRTRYEGIKMLRKFGLIIRRVSVIRSRRTRPLAEEAPSCLSSGFFLSGASGHSASLSFIPRTEREGQSDCRATISLLRQFRHVRTATISYRNSLEVLVIRSHVRAP